MGCDIHLYKEKKINGKWTASDKWVKDIYDGSLNVNYNEQFSDRDYDLFGLLANVRRHHEGLSIEHKGIPEDCCEEIANRYLGWGCDAHSPSFFTKKELEDLWKSIADKKVFISGMKDKKEIEKLKDSLLSENPDYDLLYSYCQSTNMEGYAHFNLPFPAQYVFSNLVKIIESLNETECEDQRVVFWFDN